MQKSFCSETKIIQCPRAENYRQQPKEVDEKRLNDRKENISLTEKSKTSQMESLIFGLSSRFETNSQLTTRSKRSGYDTTSSK